MVKTGGEEKTRKVGKKQKNRTKIGRKLLKVGGNIVF